MTAFTQTFELRSTEGIDTFEVTGQVQTVVEASGISQGMACVHTPGSTAAVTTIEYESGAIADLKDLLQRLAPMDGQYDHNLRWGDGNGYSHLRAALLGPSLTVPVYTGALVLGTWQQIMVLDFDNKPRRRKVVVSVVGEAG